MFKSFSRVHQKHTDPLTPWVGSLVNALVPLGRQIEEEQEGLERLTFEIDSLNVRKHLELRISRIWQRRGIDERIL